MKLALHDVLSPCAKCYPTYWSPQMGVPLISPTLRIHRDGDEPGMTACGYDAKRPDWYWASTTFGATLAYTLKVYDEPPGEFDLLLMFYNDIARWAEAPHRPREIKRLVEEYGDRLDSQGS